MTEPTDEEKEAMTREAYRMLIKMESNYCAGDCNQCHELFDCPQSDADVVSG